MKETNAFVLLAKQKDKNATAPRFFEVLHHYKGMRLLFLTIKSKIDYLSKMYKFRYLQQARFFVRSNFIINRNFFFFAYVLSLEGGKYLTSVNFLLKVRRDEHYGS